MSPLNDKGRDPPRLHGAKTNQDKADRRQEAGNARRVGFSFGEEKIVSCTTSRLSKRACYGDY